MKSRIVEKLDSAKYNLIVVMENEYIKALDSYIRQDRELGKEKG
jgi:hypothetical protein